MAYILALRTTITGKVIRCINKIRGKRVAAFSDQKHNIDYLGKIRLQTSRN